MTKIRPGSSHTTFVYWNQPKLKPGDKVKVSTSTVGLKAARKRRVPVIGDRVTITWYFTQGPCRKVVGVLIGSYAYTAYNDTVIVAIVQTADGIMRVDSERVSRGKQ